MKIQRFKGVINYTVWSDVFVCPFCQNEHVFFDEAFDIESKRIKNVYQCPHCESELKKRSVDIATENVYDTIAQCEVEITKKKPVLLNYSVEKERFEKLLDNEDLELIEKIEGIKNPYWYPGDSLPNGYNINQPKRSRWIH